VVQGEVTLTTLVNGGCSNHACACLVTLVPCFDSLGGRFQLVAGSAKSQLEPCTARRASREGVAARRGLRGDWGRGRERDLERRGGRVEVWCLVLACRGSIQMMKPSFQKRLLLNFSTQGDFT